MALSWDESLALGNTEIDEQHREIFSRFDSLSLACREGHGEESLKSVFMFLDEYVVRHFAAEEALMERSNYPGLLEQREQHVAFRRTLADMHARNLDDAARHKLSLDVDRMLIQWFVNHIRNLDAKLVAFVTGLKQ